MGKGQVLAGFGAVFVIVAFIVFIFLVIGYDNVAAGHVGILDRFGVVSDNPLPPGLWWTGIFTNTISMSTQVQKSEYPANAASKDLQIVTTNVALNFRLDPAKAVEIYKTIGIGYQDVISSPVVQEAVKSQTAKYNAEELITKREEVKAKITDDISNRLADKGIIVTQVSIINFAFSPEFEKAIEAKQVAEQKALEAKNNLAATEFNARALELQKDLLDVKKLDLQKIWIDKWDGKLPATLCGGEDQEMILQLPYQSPTQTQSDINRGVQR